VQAGNEGKRDWEGGKSGNRKEGKVKGVVPIGVARGALGA